LSFGKNGSEKVYELSPVNHIQETSFPRAWQKAVAFIDEEGIFRVIGGPKEGQSNVIERKKIKDTCQQIVLTDNAITQMENAVMHPKFPFGVKQLEEYCRQLTPEYVEYWQNLPPGDMHKFKYLYLERFLFPFDQMVALRENLAKLIEYDLSSNRVQAITWRPPEDAYNDEPPCLQRLQLFYLGKDENGVAWVDVRWDWRSRDINALLSNKICLTKMLYFYVLTPNNARIKRDIENIASLHCYEDRLDKLYEAAWFARTGNQFFIDTPMCQYPYIKA